MGQESVQLVENLMREVRKLVVGMEEERRILKTNLRLRCHQLSESSHNSPATHEAPMDTAASTGASLSSIASGAANVSSSAATSTSVTTGSASKPPSYKTAVKITSPTTGTIARGNQRSNRRAISELLRTFPRLSMSTLPRGALIVLEGLDRVGKSTLARGLVDHLQRISRPVTQCRFPDRTTQIGKLLDEILKDTSKKIDEHALHLLFSANRWELNKKIRKSIAQGLTVVIDRYSYSGIAYSSAKRDLQIEWCRETERGLPRPDLVIYLELSREAQYQREGFGEERFETKELQELIRYQYYKIMDMSQETWLKVIVDNKNEEQVLSEIILPVERCLDACAHKEIGDLDFIA